MADLQLMEVPAAANGGGAGEEVTTGVGVKRQRRPSVRLGGIGGQAATATDSQIRRSKQGRISPHPLHPDPSSQGELSMVAGGVLMGRTPSRTLLEHRSLHLSEETAGPRRGSGNASERKSSGGGPKGRRVRTNWASKFEEGTDAPDLRSSEDDAAEEVFRDYDEEDEDDDSGSPQKEDSRVRVSDGREGAAAAAASEEMDPDVALGSDFGLWNSRRLRSLGDGSVRAWLNGLGLGRYVPVFQIHEVDDEVLPFLTLEDLKEMGITAVGSRRKIYFAIQKLGKSLP